MKLDAPRSLRAVAAAHTAAVFAAAGNKRAACSQLGISYHTLNALLRDYKALEGRTLVERVATATDAISASMQTEASDAAAS